MREVGFFLLATLLATGPVAAQQATVESSKSTPPQLVKQTKPVYPSEAFAQGTEGTVLLEVVIDENGKVQSPRVLKSVPGLDGAAIDAVKKWRFKAAETDGKPVRSKAQVPVAFCIYQSGCSASSGKPSRR